MQKTIKEHETTIENLKKDSETKIRNLTLDNAINGKLANVDDKYKKLLETQFNKEKLTIKEDGTIEGLEEQFKTITETYSEWFEEKSNRLSPSLYLGSNTIQSLEGIEAPSSKEPS